MGSGTGETPATVREITQAVHGLTDEEHRKLRVAAQIFLYGRSDQGADDLVNEALVRTYDGRRKWNKTIPFFIHLKGAMRSIAGHGAGKAESVLSLEAAVGSGDGKGKLLDTVADKGSSGPAPEAEIAKIRIDSLKQAFATDAQALLILDAWAEEMEMKEILELGLSKDEYNAATKRIRRHVLSLPTGKGTNHV